ncbi:Peptidase A1 domain-containing protein [Mycena venus]|uniref:Peptidase A1 domain-containing protein n=1 Tax=Mycena venus TaxID=2733690 RepID=A0A8H6YB49_9AGAR|nr:Peptidase A1 domain-containing protein [Mycena venus]
MSSLFLALSLLVSVTLALPATTSRRFSARYNDELNTIGKRETVVRGNVQGTIGLGDNSDLYVLCLQFFVVWSNLNLIGFYTVPIQLGDTTAVVNLDTGSSDLWVISTDCATNACAKAGRTTRVPTLGLTKTGAQVTMRYGDSTTGTYAVGPIAAETVSIAGVAIDNQLFAAINDTTNSVVQFGAAGIFGLGFPSESQIQAAAVIKQFGKTGTTDHFVASSYADGPLISRIAQSGALQMPMFTISLQRSTIDISGTGALTLGTLPDGVDNSSLTWVPVRLYSPAEGGITPPTFASNEVYPLRWEIDLDGVFLDGVELAPSKIPTSGNVDANRMSALIDTGNSILRGAKRRRRDATLACAKAHNLTFKIGGKMFPIDPRDLPGPVASNNASTCVIDNLVATDPPGVGALFRWSLGDPFMKSNLVAFHYGNLTNPSQDPPRIGFLSQVPANAAALLTQAVQDAVEDGGNFESTIVVAPTAAADLEAEVTVVAVSASLQAAQLTATHAPATTAPAKTAAPAASGGAAEAAPAPIPSGSTSNGKTSTKSNGATPRTGIWDPWLVALGAVALSATLTTDTTSKHALVCRIYIALHWYKHCPHQGADWFMNVCASLRLHFVVDASSGEESDRSVSNPDAVSE